MEYHAFNIKRRFTFDPIGCDNAIQYQLDTDNHQLNVFHCDRSLKCFPHYEQPLFEKYQPNFGCRNSKSYEFKKNDEEELETDEHLRI